MGDKWWFFNFFFLEPILTVLWLLFFAFLIRLIWKFLSEEFTRNKKIEKFYQKERKQAIKAKKTRLKYNYDTFFMNNLLIFDTHCHLADEKYQEHNISEIIQAAEKVGAKNILNVGYDKKSNQKVV